ncbi:MAG: PIN domain-containing protein [Thermoleophilaceae bacterium]
MTPDTSVLVAAFSSWHPAHSASRAAVSSVRDLIAHVELETYSVLTRLPAPHRAPFAVAADYLARQFAGDRLALGRAARSSLIARLASLAIEGGRAYDGLIALTAAEHERTLLTRDRRSMATYERVGTRFELVG